MSVPHDMMAFNRSIIDKFRANNGQVEHEQLKGVQLVLLTTTGARTGQAHTTPLAYFRDGPARIVLWASAMAAPAHPAWYHNLVAHPSVTIELGTAIGSVSRLAGTASIAEGAERERLFTILTNARPEVAAHQDRTDREIPLVVIEHEG